MSSTYTAMTIHIDSDEDNAYNNTADELDRYKDSSNEALLHHFYTGT